MIFANAGRAASLIKRVQPRAPASPDVGSRYRRNQMMDRFLLVVYASSATREMTPAELVDLLENARFYNERAGITGMLLHSGGNFIQAIEGPEPEVRSLVERIERDPRHRDFTELVRDYVQERQFPGWTMGFKDSGVLTASERAGINSFLRQAIDTDGFVVDPHEAVYFLRTFRDVAR